MAKYKVCIDCDYVMGHLRYGHFEGVIEAESADEAKRMVLDDCDFLELVIDDYEVDDYALDAGSMTVQEVK